MVGAIGAVSQDVPELSILSKGEQSMSIGIKDIARRANVSIATVSLVLNNKAGVSPETRRRVLSIIDEMGYKPNLSTRQAPTRRGTIRFIVFNFHGQVVADTPFFASLTGAIDAESKKDGFRLVISHISERDIEAELRLIREEQTLKGFILLATEMNEGHLQHFLELDIPFVVLDSYFEMKPLNQVVINNCEGVSKAIHHLYEKGHRQIGYCGSSVMINNFLERSQAFYQTMRQLNVPVQERHIFRVQPTIDGAYQDMLARLSDSLDLPTALFADNDLIAMGVLKALKDKGVSVPGDVSLIGFDDLPYCEVTDPPLTTIRVFNRSMGKLAVKRLKSLIEEGTEEFVKIEVGTALIQRDSVAEVQLSHIDTAAVRR
jgi:LacI family transcriptional regulator